MCIRWCVSYLNYKMHGATKSITVAVRKKKVHGLFFYDVRCSMNTLSVKTNNQFKRFVLRSQKNTVNSRVREYLWFTVGGHLLRLHGAGRQEVW